MSPTRRPLSFVSSAFQVNQALLGLVNNGLKIVVVLPSQTKEVTDLLCFYSVPFIEVAEQSLSPFQFSSSQSK
jgi:hypothetical protein